ncbi:MAG: hypothetical protein CMO80_12310 [Verrucomicrobiales bacterium]|nr:hypothetical protein [Verrucomicrobiales bacterium]|tara:strand:+ start:4684 stop:5355 length:672 start_codon:yes stop_codon:yes gene_type:complete
MGDSKQSNENTPDLGAGLKMIRKIGEGGMGAVYEAVQVRLDRRVAVKVLAPRLSADKEFLKRFKREARTAAAVNHPNLVQVHDIGESEKGLHYFLMEYIEGENLAQRLKRTGRFPVNEALQIISCVASALNAALDKDIIHRDIKPDNIMITTGDIVKLAEEEKYKEAFDSCDTFPPALNTYKYQQDTCDSIRTNIPPKHLPKTFPYTEGPEGFLLQKRYQNTK